jgi:hypothetical protein
VIPWSSDTVPAGDSPSAVSQPIRRSRPPSLSWLRALPYIPRYIAQTMPWTTLITGCAAGTAVLAVVAQIARNDWPFGQGSVRLAFLPAIAALAFVPRARFRPLTQATPVPTWVGQAGHILLAVPVLALTCWAQLSILAHTFDIPTIQPSGNAYLGGSHPAAIYPLIAQLTGWCMVVVGVAACVDRSRYADLGGAIAAPVSLVAIAVAWYLPVTSRVLELPSATARGVTIAWYVIATVALALTCGALADRWHRYSRKLRWLPFAQRDAGAPDTSA